VELLACMIRGLTDVQHHADAPCSHWSDPPPGAAWLVLLLESRGNDRGPRAGDRAHALIE